MDDLVIRIRERVQDPERFIDEDPGTGDFPYPPTSEAAIAAADEQLGFRIPELLRRLFTEVANGGFGPVYGIAGVNRCGVDEDLCDLETLHADQSTSRWLERFPTWPPQVLRFVYLGCSMYVAVDASSENHPLYVFEPNMSAEELGYENCLEPMRIGLHQWLRDWVSDKDLWKHERE